MVGAPAVARPPRAVIEELQLTEGVQLGGRRDVPHDHSGGVDRHGKVSGVFHRVGLPAEDVGDLQRSKAKYIRKIVFFF